MLLDELTRIWLIVAIGSGEYAIYLFHSAYLNDDKSLYFYFYTIQLHPVVKITHTVFFSCFLVDFGVNLN